MRPIFEITIAILIFGGLRLLPVPYSGQVAVVGTVIAVSFLLYRRGQSWRTLGLSAPSSWRNAAAGALVVALVIGSVAILAFAVVPLLIQWAGPPRESAITDIGSNIEFLLLLVMVWTSVAFGEEMLFRGFLMNRIAEIFDFSRLGWIVAIFVQAVLFGIGHFYQGPSGMLLAALIALIFGLFYLIARRNLLPLIIAHGIIATVALSQSYWAPDSEAAHSDAATPTSDLPAETMRRSPTA